MEKFLVYGIIVPSLIAFGIFASKEVSKAVKGGMVKN